MFTYGYELRVDFFEGLYLAVWAELVFLKKEHCYDYPSFYPSFITLDTH